MTDELEKAPSDVCVPKNVLCLNVFRRHKIIVNAAECFPLNSLTVGEKYGDENNS